MLQKANIQRPTPNFQRRTEEKQRPAVLFLFRSMFDDVMRNPYLTGVLSGRMTPEFATDQAEAAIRAMCDDGEETEEK